MINEQSGNAFGTVNRIKPIIIITFVTTNVVHNGITFGAGIGVGIGNRDRNIGTVENRMPNNNYHSCILNRRAIPFPPITLCLEYGIEQHLVVWFQFQSSLWKLLILDMNTWNHITKGKSFVFDRNIWYLINVQTNDYYYQIGIVSWNHIIVDKLLTMYEIVGQIWLSSKSSGQREGITLNFKPDKSC